MEKTKPDALESDFNSDHFKEANYRESFSIDLPPLPDFDPSRTPQKNLSFVTDFTEVASNHEFTPTPKKNVDASTIVFPSPIRPDIRSGEPYSDILENDENANPETLKYQNKLQLGVGNGMNSSTKIAISIIKENIKSSQDWIKLDDLSSKVTA